MRESVFQKHVVDRLEETFPGCFVIKNDPNYCQGVCDLLVLYEDRWAMLEVKASRTARERPNQDFYVKRFGKMSYSSFIYPENEEEVFHELQLAFSTRRKARIS